MKIFGLKFNDKKMKKILYTAVFAVLVIWFVYRFVMVAIESRMVVYNPIRDAAASGIVVESMIVNNKQTVVKIPIDIRNNRAYISGNHRAKVAIGQRVGSGVIKSVSNGIDFNTGMYIIRTEGTRDGVNYIDVPIQGLCVPAYAVRDNSVMIAQGGVAVRRDVEISNQDSDIACIAKGIADGDVVILSKVSEGQKIKNK